MAEDSVGKVAVEVVPDASNFRKEAEAELEKQNIDPKAVDLVPEIDANMAELQTRMEQVAKSLDKAVSLKVNFDDAASIEAGIARINAELANLGAVDISVDLNEDELLAAKAELESQLRDVGVDIKVNLDDTGSIERAIAQIEARLNDLRSVTLNVELDEASLLEAKAELEAKLDERKPVVIVPEVSEPAAVVAEVEIAKIARDRKVNIKPILQKGAIGALSVVSVLSGWDALSKSIGDAHEFMLKLFTNLPQIGAMTFGVLGLAGAFISAAANVITLIGSLAQLLPLILALPGIAIGLGVMVVALKDFNTVLPDVAKQFTALQQTISDGFFAVAKGPINDLLTTALPLLKTGVAGTATAIGGFFASLSGDLGASGGFLSQLPDMFTKLNESIDLFAAHTPALANIASIFGQIGSQLLPPLADLVGGIADKFSGWLTGITAGQGLSNVVNGAINSLSGLFDILQGAIGIFSAFWSAASDAGGATLQDLGQALNDIADRLKDPKIQAALTGLFQGASQAVNNFLALAGPAFTKVFGGLATILGNVLPIVGTVLGQVSTVLGSLFSDPKVQQGLQAFVSGIGEGISHLLPALAPIGTLIAGLGPTLGLLANEIGQVFGALAPTFGELIGVISPIIVMLSGPLITVLHAISPLITTLGTAVASLLSQLIPALTPVLDLIAQLVSTLLPQLMPIINALVPLIMSLVNIALPVIAAVLPVIATLLGDLLAAIMPIITMLTDLLNMLAPLLIPVLTFLADLLAHTLHDAIDGVIKMITGFLEILTGLINFVKDVFTGQWGAAWDDIKQIFIGIWNLIVGFVETALNVGVLGIFKKGFGLIKGVVTGGWDSIKGLFDDAFKAVNGIVEDGIDAVLNFFKGLWGRLSGVISDLWSSVKGAFATGMSKIGTAISDGIKDDIQFFKDLPGKILAALGNLDDLLTSAGKKIIQGLIDGIGSMFGAVKDKLKDLTDKLTSWKGPEAVDRVLLHGAGQLVIEGFINGLESRYHAVRTSLAGLTKDVAGTDFTATANLGVNAAALAGTRLALPTVNPGGVSSVASQVAAAMGGGTTKVLNYFAAPGNSLSSEEELFAAAGRGRMVW